MSASHAEVVVIGGGPAGYTAAIRAAQLGLDALCIDARSRAGGTCLHVGCIPSKALLSSTERLARARSELGEHGITTGEITFDLAALMRRKEEIVEQLTGGVEDLLGARDVRRVEGRAHLDEVGRVHVEGADGAADSVEYDHLVLAPGSGAAELPGVTTDGERIFSSDEALSLPGVPEHLAVIGGGYIGLELGSVWRRLGSEVTVIELEERLLPQMDVDLSTHVEQSLADQGIEFLPGRSVEDARSDENGVRLRLRDEDRDGTEEIECSHALVAVGREPATRGLGLEDAGIDLTADGFVRVDERFRTTRPDVFAIGDVVGEPMLAHKAQLEALACIEAIAGRGAGSVHYDAVPSVVYTWPEVASVGRPEQELRENGVRYRTGRASLRHDARALCTGENVGFVKLLVEDGSDRLLGAHVFGPHAGSLIHELVLVCELGGSVEELGRSAHAHPTLNESVREAALDAHERAIHH